MTKDELRAMLAELRAEEEPTPYDEPTAPTGIVRVPGRDGLLTVASRTTNDRTAPLPGAGGWTPAPWVPYVVAVGVGALGALGTLLTSGAALTAAGVVGTLLSGGAVALGALFGIRSAGPRRDAP